MVTECPLCKAAIDPGDRAATCAGCGARLGDAGGRVAVAATAEFAVPDLPFTVSDAAIAHVPATACAWCGRGGDQVRKLLGSSAVAICDGCVALCVDILAAELGPDWRPR